jgi:hypothetical protein
MTAPVRDAQTVEAARAALLCLFEWFELQLLGAGYGDDVGLGTGLRPEPLWEYCLIPNPRPQVVEGWTRELWPVLRRVEMPLGDNDANALST